MAPFPAKNLEATALHAVEHDAPARLLPPIVARKEAVRKFMEVDVLKGSPQSDSGSNFAISIVGSNLFPPIMPPPSKPNHRARHDEYTIQMLHGMPSPCKIRPSPALLHSPAMSKNQRLAHIEMKIDGMLSSQCVHSPPTISKSNRLARIERTIDGIIFSSLGHSPSDPASPELQRLHGALLNSRSPDVQLSKSKSRRIEARAAPRHPASLPPRSLPSRLSRLENTVSDCLERLSVSQDGNAGSWHWEKFQRLQRIEDRLDQILTIAGSGVDRALQPVQHDAIVKRNQLLPHVVMAAAAQQRRMHALDLMKLQGKNERELHAALAFKADGSSKHRDQPRPFVPVC
jgi:hypothetical protein